MEQDQEREFEVRVTTAPVEYDLPGTVSLEVIQRPERDGVARLPFRVVLVREGDVEQQTHWYASAMFTALTVKDFSEMYLFEMTQAAARAAAATQR